jgi:hypothetical protein
VAEIKSLNSVYQTDPRKIYIPESNRQSLLSKVNKRATESTNAVNKVRRRAGLGCIYL